MAWEPAPVGGPPRPRRRLSRPALIAAAAAGLVVAALVGYGLLALVSPGKSATALDACLFGTWTGTRENYPVIEGGLRVTATGRGPTMIFRPDGVNVIEYPPGAPLTAQVGAVTVTTIYAGSVTSHYATRNRTLLASDVSVQGSYTVMDNGSVYASGPITPSMVNTEPKRYVCSASTLRLSPAGGGSAEFSRAPAG